jgi:hypothetical protein
MVMLDDMPSFWKKGDKRRVKREFVDSLISAGWARLADETPKAEEGKK